jgi:hypothetical protein
MAIFYSRGSGCITAMCFGRPFEIKKSINGLPPRRQAR